MDFKDIKDINTQNAKPKKNPFIPKYFAQQANPYAHLKLKPFGTIYRITSSMVEISITILIRIIAFFIIAKPYISKKSIEVITGPMGYTIDASFKEKLTNKFFIEYIFQMNQAQYLVPSLFLILVAFLVGSLYYIILPIGPGKTTWGGKIFKFIIVNKHDLSRMSFSKSLARYMCGIFPLVGGILISVFFFNTMAAKTLTYTIFFCYVFWFDISPQIFFNGQTMSDRICGTIILRKFWFKK